MQRDVPAEEHGDKALALTLATKPEAIVRAMVALLPKEVELTQPLDEMTDEQLASIAEALLAKYGGEPPLEAGAQGAKGADVAHVISPNWHGLPAAVASGR